MFKIECTLYGKNAQGERDRAYYREDFKRFFEEHLEDALEVIEEYENKGYKVEFWKSTGWLHIG